MLSISPWHGVTTVVMGNCGFGVAPTRAAHRDMIVKTLEKVEGMSTDALFAGLGEEWPFETFPEYLDAIDKNGVAVNVAEAHAHHSAASTAAEHVDRYAQIAQSRGHGGRAVHDCMLAE